MSKISCRIFYGLDCDFVCEHPEFSDVIEEFEKHAKEKHDIQFSKEALMQFIMRQ